jgi:uncharacterized protein (DUF58 family)
MNSSTVLSLLLLFMLLLLLLMLLLLSLWLILLLLLLLLLLKATRVSLDPKQSVANDSAAPQAKLIDDEEIFRGLDSAWKEGSSGPEVPLQQVSSLSTPSEKLEVAA